MTKRLSNNLFQAIKPLGLAILLTAGLTGCASLTPWTQMTKTECKDGARDFTATIPVNWMRFNQARYFLITRDGSLLDGIYVDRIKFKDKLEFTKKQFSPDMTPQDLAEVEIDNLKSDQSSNHVEISDNRPTTIDGNDGFCMDYSLMTTEDGLKVQGIQCDFIYGQWVYRILYQATAQHYFAAYKNDFDTFLKSFKVTAKKESPVASK